ncbi:MAG: hypothetical protein KJ970_00465 [Candidatus Eisenbacteria bacterium]|uniref:Uncharacterized protein n=1 Tax=Eiseniibacteriota bacterium TaxID=2212470 RepID=A0A948RTW3_UNCEI|nr:hypothetical protein [Candidatus Eisenbacteria bacterium]MBU1951151.1 hypothetical protein [Candidatus Eisenbacteria bacterium]MBU2689372.1 hypothetical protein [Candidatus Eisenbacteria bacterium]
MIGRIFKLLLILLAGLAAGAVVTYFVMSGGIPQKSPPTASHSASLDSLEILLDPVRASLVACQIPLYPGPPPDLDPATLQRVTGAVHGSVEFPIWWGPVPADSSLIRLNGLVTGAVEKAGGRVLLGWEETPEASGLQSQSQGGDGSELYISYCTRIPGQDPRSSLWLGIGSDESACFLLCLQKMKAR